MPDTSVVKLREKAQWCRRLSKTINDKAAIQSLRKMADDLETEADSIDKKLRDCGYE